MSVPDYPLGETLDFKFTSRQFSDGVPTTLAGTPVIEVYEDNSIVQIVAGETLTVDFDGVTGLNNLRIVATGANGYETGKSYHAIISVGTVGGTSVVGEVVAQFSIERSAALMPTVAGRTLDVAATGEAGVDFDNILGTLDAAEIGANAITAAKIATDAIGAAQIAANAIGASELATDAIGDAQIATGAIASTAFATSAITADAMAPNSITASELAADCIGTSQIAASAATEIADAVWDTDATGNQTLGTFGQAIGDPATNAETIYEAVVTDAAGTNVAADIIAVQSDTDDIQTRLPAALVGGAMDSDVSAIQANAITAASIANAAIDAATFAAGAIDAAAIAANAIGASELATDAIGSDQLAVTAINEIADGVWDEAMSGHVTVGTSGQVLAALGAIRAGEVADAGPLAGDFDVDGFTEATNDHFNGMVMTFTNGVLIGQSRVITDYTGAGQNCVFAEPWTEAPADNDDFIISPPGMVAGGTLQQVLRLFITILDQATGQLDAGSFQTGVLGYPQQNQAFDDIEFLMVDSTDHVTPETGLTPTGQRSIDGGAFGAVAGSIAEIGVGIYQFDATAADMNGGTIMFRFSDAAADDTFVFIKTRV